MAAGIAQRELAQGLVSIEPARGRGAVGEQRVGVLTVDPATAAYQPGQLGVGKQDHEELATAGGRRTLLNPPRHQLFAQLGSGELAAVADRVDHNGHRPLDRAVVEPVHGPQLLAGHALYSRSGQVQQPGNVVRADEVPGRSQRHACGAPHHRPEASPGRMDPGLEYVRPPPKPSGPGSPPAPQARIGSRRGRIRRRV